MHPTDGHWPVGEVEYSFQIEQLNFETCIPTKTRYDDINDLRGEDLKMTQNDARPSERTLRSSSSSKSGGGSVHGDVRTILVAAAAMVLALLVAHAQ